MTLVDETRIRGVADSELFDYGADISRLIVRAWRMLADGNPIDAARVQDLIEELAIAPETAHDFLQSVTERDGDGNIVGVLGLSLNDHAHGFIVNGVSFSTWCAVDTLFLPAMLGQPAEVKSVSPLSKKSIRLTVGPQGVQALEPASTVVSLPVVRSGEVDTGSTEGIWRTFCHRVFFFAAREEAEQWAETTENIEIVSVHEAFEYAMQTWSKILPYAR